MTTGMATGGPSHGSVTEAAGQLASLSIIAGDDGKNDERSSINQRQHLELMDLSDDELSLVFKVLSRSDAAEAAPVCKRW